jgi:hypothetical protein
LRVPDCGAAPTANADVPLPADVAVCGGTCPQNSSIQMLEVPCFEVGHISLIRPWRSVSSKLRVPDCVAAPTSNADVPLPADVAACGGTCPQNNPNQRLKV